MSLLLAVAAAAEPDPVALADKVLREVTTAYEVGAGTMDPVYVWSVRLRDTQARAGDPGAAAAHLQRMRALLARTEALAATGQVPAHAPDAARWYVAQAEAEGSGPAGLPGKPPPAAAAGSGGPIEACFQQCDREWTACASGAENLRLGLGAVTDAECSAAAERKCGAGRSQTLTECRERELRACAAARATATCAKEQALCTARCR